MAPASSALGAKRPAMTAAHLDLYGAKIIGVGKTGFSYMLERCAAVFLPVKIALEQVASNKKPWLEHEETSLLKLHPECTDVRCIRDVNMYASCR